ncbi:chloramphenicol phosphotransferase CPT family protein [Enterovibrio makurazakiensis]|uniref:Chloramphenicol phosphotransferase CPT family protein n=1 Tax=Enterovibrio gelatinilyticus TaxID=2899819 RepID=A0ABT5R144_9GAMM|nr:AAA family ATPase [Enterovibrio sp. ZSDZ42]MDD1793993.1 chloramphenicol phosphotransferase CPT family protein [Enterovibrio sp. ZSDZ42]
MYPQIILLNGTGSSGKTSIANTLIEQLPVQYLNFSIDSVLYALPPSDLEKMMEGKAITRQGYDYPTLVRGYHQAAKGLANAGCKLILDNAWIPDEEKRDMLEAFSEFDVCLVGVKCHLLVAMERERQRGDRAIGLAESEYNHVHTNMNYDFEVDTTTLSPQANTDKIMTFLKNKPVLSGASISKKELEQIA